MSINSFIKIFPQNLKSGWGKIFFLVFIIGISSAKGQTNYVLNPSFEDYSQCPNSFDQISFANYWNCLDTNNNHDCIPEYCNKCAGASVYCGVPWSGSYYQYPRTGSGFVQTEMLYDSINPLEHYQRDYLKGKLYKRLTANKSYCVSFYVNLTGVSNYAISGIGAYFDNGSIDTTTNYCSPLTSYTPQVKGSNIISDTQNWVKIEGSFTALGNEQYITIGNFSDFAHTNYILSPAASNTHFTWYLIDDVSVIESDAIANAGGYTRWKSKVVADSIFIGTQETIPDIEWYRNGILIDTLHAGFYIHDTVNTQYVVKQSLCGNVKYDTANVYIVPEGVATLEAKNFGIAPNPAHDEVTVTTDGGGMVMRMYDVNGKMVQSQQLTQRSNKVNFNSNVSSGVYIVECEDNNGYRGKQRIIISR